MASMPPGIVNNPAPKSENFGSAEEYERAIIEGLERLSPADFTDFSDYTYVVDQHLQYLSPNRAALLRNICAERWNSYRAEQLRKAEAENTCKYFDVAENNVIIPHEDSSFSKWFDRFLQFKITNIVDTNRNGKPDSGDTGIDNYGDFHKNIQFNGQPTFYSSSEGPCNVTCPVGGCVALGMKWDVENLRPDSPEHLAIALANNTNTYFNNMYDGAVEAKEQVSDNKALAAAVVGAAILAQAHPVGQAITVVAAITGAAAGEAYFVADAYSGIEDAVEGREFDEKRGEYSFQAALGIVGGAPALKGISAAEFLKAPVTVMSDAAEFASGAIRGAGSMGGGIPALASAGADGSIVGGAVAIDDAASVAGVCVAGGEGVVLPGVAGGTTMFAMESGVSRWSDPPDGYGDYRIRPGTPDRNPLGRRGREHNQTNEIRRMLSQRNIDPKSEIGKSIMEKLHRNLKKDGLRNCDFETLVGAFEDVLAEMGII